MLSPAQCCDVNVHFVKHGMLFRARKMRGEASLHRMHRRVRLPLASICPARCRADIRINKSFNAILSPFFLVLLNFVKEDKATSGNQCA
jgi:hypothetical protein